MNDEPSLTPRIRAALEALEEPHGLTLKQWTDALMMLAPEAFEDPPSPAAPCLDRPGSPARIRAMSERAAAGRALFHREDLPGPCHFVEPRKRARRGKRRRTA